MRLVPIFLVGLICLLMSLIHTQPLSASSFLMKRKIQADFEVNKNLKDLDYFLKIYRVRDIKRTSLFGPMADFEGKDSHRVLFTKAAFPVNKTLDQLTEEFFLDQDIIKKVMAVSQITPCPEEQNCFDLVKEAGLKTVNFQARVIIHHISNDENAVRNMAAELAQVNNLTFAATPVLITEQTITNYDKVFLEGTAWNVYYLDENDNMFVVSTSLLQFNEASIRNDLNFVERWGMVKFLKREMVQSMKYGFRFHQ